MLSSLLAVITLIVAFAGFPVSALGQATWIHQNPSTSPPPRDTHAMAYDPVSRQAVVFGGFSRVPPASQLADTWTWDGSTWTESTVQPHPGARETFGMASDGQGGVVLFGGHTFGTAGENSDTWRFSNGTWTELLPSTIPPARRSHGMTETAQGPILFGGQGNGGSILDDTWVWNGSDWQRSSPPLSPSARQAPGMAFDSIRGTVVLFGGVDVSGQVLSDTWEWNGTTWTERSPATTPNPGFRTSMTYDPRREKTILLTGSPTATWEWNGLDWSPLTTVATPSLRAGFTLAFDEVHQKVLLFGGRDQNSNSLDDTWLLSVPTVQASFSTFGSGCPGTAGVPSLDVRSGQLPWVRETFAMEFTSLPMTPLSPVVAVFGLSRTTWGPLALPFDLTPLGMPGCSALVAADIMANLGNMNGAATWRVPIPDDPRLISQTFFVQGLVIDFWANPGNAVVTNAGEGVIGAR